MSAPERHPATMAVLKWFEYGHLPADLGETSERFATLAHQLVAALPDGPELTTCLRKLLEAKDCALRATIDARPF